MDSVVNYSLDLDLGNLHFDNPPSCQFVLFVRIDLGYSGLDFLLISFVWAFAISPIFQPKNIHSTPISMKVVFKINLHDALKNYCREAITF